MGRERYAGSGPRSTLSDVTRLATVVAFGMAVTACSGNLAADGELVGPRPGPSRQYDPKYDPSVFGEGGVSVGILGGDEGDEKACLPVNKYIWQGALDTLSFLPLASTDPFTGVIATEWGSAPEAPGERFKVTAYVLNPGLSAASLKVAVYREVQTENGLWVPAPVNPDTARQLEDAILTRARQIRIAAVEDGTAG